MNKIIVESKNDKSIYTAIAEYLRFSLLFENFENMENGIDDVNQFANPTKLLKQMNSIKMGITKIGGEHKIGFLFDLDNQKLEEKIQYINNAIYLSFKGDISKNLIKEINKLEEIKFNNSTVYFCCYFINVHGYGTIETLLKSIVSKDATFSNCLSEWKNCFEKKGKNMSDSDFNKFWINTYIRYDTCNSQESKQAGKNCSLANFKTLIDKNIFDLKNEYLNDLKTFFRLF